MVQEHLGAMGSISKQAQSIVDGAASLATPLLQDVMAKYRCLYRLACSHVSGCQWFSKCSADTAVVAPYLTSPHALLDACIVPDSDQQLAKTLGKQ